ncbi:MAG: NAD(P)-binding domain-containing protein [Caulobacterales bacterium]|nr:NAD(P)-binding domain-containing protein [Caulobacterales bacterium]
MKRTTTVIIGAGQSGLAMSRHLTARGVDHVVLERGEVANSWRTERWDSLRLLTPNWQSRLPGDRYRGPDPDGYMTMPEVIARLDRYAEVSRAPVETHTQVLSARAAPGGYKVATTRGVYRCRTLVIASGANNIAHVPALAAGLPSSVRSVTPMTYKRPTDLPDGGVLIVGASASGVQLARELQASGRPVTLSVGEHVRAPRTYRGRDIKWWMNEAGLLDLAHDEADDLARVRRTPSMQLAGGPDRAAIDLNSLQEAGVEMVGRMAGLRDGKALFSGSLANACASADLKMNRLLDTIDAWADENGFADMIPPPERFRPTEVSAAPRLSLDLKSGAIKTVLWATGYRPDYSWLHLDVLDRKGRLRHDGGVVAAPGVYALGLPFLRRRKSTLIDGAGRDARELADHLIHRLDDRRAA